MWWIESYQRMARTIHPKGIFKPETPAGLSHKGVQPRVRNHEDQYPAAS
jgi:hypothetical protein